jgi:hypothetical protein
MVTYKTAVVKIIQMTPFQKDGNQIVTIYGLGDDEKVYIWDAGKTDWYLFG